MMNVDYESPKMQEIDLFDSCILCLSVVVEGNVDDVDRDDFDW